MRYQLITGVIYKLCASARRLVFVWLMVSLSSPVVLAENLMLKESELKAAYLYNFGKFISWPDALPDSENFNYCVFNDQMISEYLQPLALRSIKGKRVRIRTLAALDDISHCRILYVGGIVDTESLLSLANNNPYKTLIVGDQESFIKKGGVIGFVMRDNRLRFKVNLTRANQLGLVIKANLLNLAVSVD